MFTICHGDKRIFFITNRSVISKCYAMLIAKKAFLQRHGYKLHPTVNFFSIHCTVPIYPVHSCTVATKVGVTSKERFIDAKISDTFPA